MFMGFLLINLLNALHVKNFFFFFNLIDQIYNLKILVNYTFNAFRVPCD